MYVCAQMSACIFAYTQNKNATHTYLHNMRYNYGVALVSRIDKIIGFFCKRAL